MVRQKSRWTIVRLDFDDQLLVSSRSAANGVGEEGNNKNKRKRSSVHHANAPSTPVPIEPRDIHRTLRSAMETSFGTLGAGMAHTIRICHYDSTDRLAIIKMPREYCPMVRSALTLLTSINDVNVVMSTIGVHGSARTVKIAALAELRRNFNARNRLNTGGGEGLSKQDEKALLRLEARMDKVRDVD